MATSKAHQKPPSKQAEAKFMEKFGKQFGGDALVDTSKAEHYEVIPTGSIDLDLALGVGGWVIGRITEVYGQPGIGKTTLMLYAVAEAQRKYPKRKIAWIDMEGTFDLAWAAMHGVILGDRFHVYTPDSAEDVADALKEMIRSGLYVMVVVDSIGAMIPEAEKEKDADEATIALQAKIVTRMLKIAGPEIRRHGVALVCINQLRANISAYGKDTQASGPWYLRFCTTHKIELKSGGESIRTKVDEDAQRNVGHPIAALVERNKVAVPNKRAKLTLFHTWSEKYGNPGIDRADEAVTIGLRYKIIPQRGGNYDLPLTDLTVKGRPNLVDAMREHPETIDFIREQALAIVSGEIVMDGDTDPLDEEGEAKEEATGMEALAGAGSGLFANSVEGTKD